MKAFAEQVVDRREKRRERLAGPGRSCDQSIVAVANRRPSALLRECGLADRCEEPVPDDRVEP